MKRFVVIFRNTLTGHMEPVKVKAWGAGQAIELARARLAKLLARRVDDDPYSVVSVNRTE